jgi:hypothetical protein
MARVDTLAPGIHHPNPRHVGIRSFKQDFGLILRVAKVLS